MLEACYEQTATAAARVQGVYRDVLRQDVVGIGELPLMIWIIGIEGVASKENGIQDDAN